MEYDTVLHKVILLAREQFPDEKERIGEGSTASEIAAWNSLTHVMLIDRIEKSFSVKFELMQMLEMQSIGDISRATFEMLG